jgi:hypothetical protein
MEWYTFEDFEETNAAGYQGAALTFEVLRDMEVITTTSVLKYVPNH